MIIHKQPQLSEQPVPTFVSKGETLAVTVGGETKTYDFSSLQAGQFMETADGYLLSALREADGLHVDLLWPIADDATEEDKFPQPVEVEEVSKLPKGEAVALSFLWLEAPEPSAETTLLVDLVQDLLASDVAVSDAFLMRTAAVFSYPEYAVGQNYKKGEIIQKGGVFFEVITDHSSLSNWPPESAGSVYRAISVSTGDDVGTLENPILYPEGVQSVSVTEGLYYSYKGKVYLCKQTMETCVWPPDSPIWQWEEVKK